MRITRKVVAALAYPPTRGAPFMVALISSVWLWGSLCDLYYTVPRLGQFGTSSVPKEMTLKEFLNRRDGGNDYVKLTNFTWCREYGRRSARSRTNQFVYCIPIVPLEDAAEPEPMSSAASLVVVVQGGPEEISAIRQLTEVQGLVDAFQAINYRDEKLILDAYPKTNRKRCRVLHHLSRPMPITAEQIEARRTEAWAHLLISSAITATCLFLFIRHCRRNRTMLPSSCEPEGSHGP